MNVQAVISENETMTITVNGVSRDFICIDYGNRFQSTRYALAGKIAIGGKNWPVSVIVYKETGRIQFSGGLRNDRVRSIVGFWEDAGSKSEHNGR